MTDDRVAARPACITTSPGHLRGKPITRGKRIAVDHVLADLAAGQTPETRLANFPYPEAQRT